MKPMVSIIVPVYNAEKFLKRCVDSILGQEYEDFELILMDDGSKDGSGQICDDYAAEDHRVRVIHQENSGVSTTRNRAIEMAEGTYIQFVDSDDWLTPDATRLLVKTAKEDNTDMVIADFYRVISERVSHKGAIEEEGVLTKEEFAECMMEHPANFYYGVLWNKLFRKEIIMEHDLRMDSEISWCEDFMFNLEYLRYAESISVIRTPIYYYVKTKGSLTAQGMNPFKIIRMKLMVFEFYNNFYKHVFDEDDYEKNRLQVYKFLVDSAKDGGVLPVILPGSTKLGNERSSVCPEVIESDGVMMDAYRSRKLMARYLEPAAISNDLTYKEAQLILFLRQPMIPGTRKELADFVSMNRGSLALVMQSLVMKGLIEVEEIRPPKPPAGKAAAAPQAEDQIKVSFLPAADPILKDFATAEQEYNQTRFAGFSEEELVQYLELEEKIKRNMIRVLL